MNGYKFNVRYNVKHIDKNSALYGVVSFDQLCKFANKTDAKRFAEEMTNKRTKKIHVIGLPVIEVI